LKSLGKAAVSLTPVKNFSAAINFRLFGYFWPLSTTPGNNFIAGVVDCCDDRGLCFLQNCEPLGKKKDAAVRRQQYLRPPGSDAAANGVTGTTKKRRILTHPD
jgi:hypothetical protein